MNKLKGEVACEAGVSIPDTKMSNSCGSLLVVKEFQLLHHRQWFFLYLLVVALTASQPLCILTYCYTADIQFCGVDEVVEPSDSPLGSSV